MLKYMPIYGSILLTLIILWIIVSTIIGSRRKIGQAVSGLYIRSTCCGATSTPFGWTADGWVLTCDECGAWQYLGDDHDNPPPGFNADGSPISRRLPAPRPSAASGPADVGQHVSRPTCTCDTIRYINGDHLPDCPTQRVGFMESNPGGVDPEVTSDLYWRPDGELRRISEDFGDEGEPLMLPPQPNIGGEGHPDYQGPHYTPETTHGIQTRFVPYDLLRDPLPGAAVHIVGSVACVGPIAVEPGDRGNVTLDSRREDEE